MKGLMSLAATLIAGAGLAFTAQAQTGQQQASADGARRVSQIIVYGNDPCPRSSEEEVVVCARRPENDRFRIPENLRARRQDSENTSWAVGAQQLEMVGRTGIQSCSPVGPGGFTGCWSEMMRRSRDERRNPETTAAVPTP
jgi:hypothetical protein